MLSIYSLLIGYKMQYYPFPIHVRPCMGEGEWSVGDYLWLVTFFSYSWMAGMNSSPTGTLFLRLK